MTGHKKAAGDGVPKAAYKNTVQRHFTISDIEQQFRKGAHPAKGIAND